MKTSLFRSKIVLLAGILVLGVAASARAGKGSQAAQTQTFTEAAGAKVSVGTNKFSTLGDIKPGDHVGIAYTLVNGVPTASHIRDLGANPPKHTKTTTVKKPATKVAGTELHAHGVVESVDVQARTLTISEKPHHKASPTATPPATS